MTRNQINPSSLLVLALSAAKMRSSRLADRTIKPDIYSASATFKVYRFLNTLLASEMAVVIGNLYPLCKRYFTISVAKSNLQYDS